MKLLAVVAVLGLVTGFALAADEVKTLSGTIVKVDGAKVTVKVGDKEIVVITDDKTVVTVDGKDAKVADLKAGEKVVVTPAEGTATKIEAKIDAKSVPVPAK